MFHSTKWLALVAAATWFASAGPNVTWADEREELEERIEILSEEVEELRELRSREQSAEVEQEIEIVGYPLREREKSQHRTREKYLAQIFAAVDALRELGRTEESRRLLETGKKLRRELERNVDGDRERRVVRRRVIRRGDGEYGEVEEREVVERENRQHEEHPEVRAARDQVRVLVLAAKALSSADRERGVDQLKNAARALELRIEGHRDEEALRIRESAPSRAQQAEWLMLASEILQKQGKADQARTVRRLADRFASTDRRSSSSQRNQELRRVQSQIRQLSGQLEELQNHVERLHRE